MKKLLSAALISMALFLFAGIASAHVTVRPAEVSQGSYEVFAVRVPSETSGTTTKVIEVRVPDGVEVLRIEPKPGWTYELTKGEGDKITAIKWTAEGKGLEVTEFTEFRFQGKVGADATELNWKAYQTYADGSKVDWVEASDGQHPASVTVVNAGAGGSNQGHGASVGTTTQQPADQAGGQEEKAATAGSNSVDRGMAIAALALGVIAVIIALVRKPRKA
ncbi:YcnI family protein [Paenibacillus sp. GCM10012307]|uniref:YcnI family protein n=1 Tax=Paenibacillus roseus TaxID=2798579 RepID=A0A934J6P3_9BACL|nr:YcnI family protein [Paenibacillus roseus]MBJ6363900.1 YcnI family protein [Paenibacillus roseus]